MENGSGPANPSVSGRERRVPRVLIIDDEPLLRRLLRRCLRDGYRLTDCADGAEAIVCLQEDPDFDVILCDVMMPVGAQAVYQAVTAQHPALASRFVFLSGAAFASDALEFLESLPNRRLDKPFDIEAVRDLVREVAAEHP